MNKKEPSQEFLERRELQKHEAKIIELRHKLKMEELKFQKEMQAKDFENRMGMHRLKRSDDYRRMGIH